MDTVDNSLCVHQVIDSYSHRFTVSLGTRAAVQALVHHIEQLQLSNQWYGKGHIRLLVDARQAIGLPIRYLFEILSDYNRPYPDLDPPKLTLAYLRSPDTVVLDIYHMMAELFDPPLTVQYFTDDNAAQRWLLQSS